MSDKKELFTAIDEALSKLERSFSLLEENSMNAVPYKDSWTAAQLLNHVTKSTDAMAAAMLTPSKHAERNPGEKIKRLKEIFLDTRNTLNAPDFIIPDPGPYTKNDVVDALKKSFDQLKLNTGQQNLHDIVSGLPLGEVTKLEILHFVLYHTLRHLRQMEKISAALNN